MDSFIVSTLLLAIVAIVAFVCFRTRSLALRESIANSPPSSEDCCSRDDDATILAAVTSKDSFVSSAKNDDDDGVGDVFQGRRIESFQREGIVIPDRSVDSRECDDFANAQPCNVSDGYVGCFECVESRYSLRVCVHVSEPLRTYDERNDRFVTLPANISPTQGYCLRERLARDLKGLNDASNASETSERIKNAKRECSAYNADWILVRRRTDGDSSYNFACRCRYPHLMTNADGPMSACSRDVACNGRGNLDEESRSSRADPFVDGRCECEKGWIAERDESNGVGPYCREATFAEWPTAFTRPHRRNDDSLELYSKEIDRAFRVAIEYGRHDKNKANGERRNVWLPNPCGKCELTVSPEGTYFCGDRVETWWDRDTGKAGLRAVHLGVRRTKDYLRNNGGRLPNSCATFEGDALWGDRLLAQFMSQDWNDGTMHAQEIGFFVNVRATNELLSDDIFQSYNYFRFRNLLTEPKNNTAISDKWHVIWTYNHYELREHRARLWRELQSLVADPVNGAARYTDICYNSDSAWTDFAFYNVGIKNSYFRMDASRVKRTLDPNRKPDRKTPLNRQSTYLCPDVRGLDAIAQTTNDTKITEREAKNIAHRMLPTCLTTQTTSNECYYRSELNANHHNPTACVMYDLSDACTVYHCTLWYPSDMDVARFVATRNVSLTKRRCPGDP